MSAAPDSGGEARIAPAVAGISCTACANAGLLDNRSLPGFGRAAILMDRPQSIQVPTGTGRPHTSAFCARDCAPDSGSSGRRDADRQPVHQQKVIAPQRWCPPLDPKVRMLPPCDAAESSRPPKIIVLQRTGA